MLNSETIKVRLVYPLLGRAGTGVSMWALANGLNTEHANWLAAGVTILGGLAWDGLWAFARERLIVNKTLSQALGTLFPSEAK